MKQYTVPAALLAALMATPAQAAEKPQTLIRKTPPANEDWGCGKGNPIIIRADGNRVCEVKKQ